jgi:hypothetical protein
MPVMLAVASGALQDVVSVGGQRGEREVEVRRAPDRPPPHFLLSSIAAVAKKLDPRGRV